MVVGEAWWVEACVDRGELWEGSWDGQQQALRSHQNNDQRRQLSDGVDCAAVVECGGRSEVRPRRGLLMVGVLAC